MKELHPLLLFLSLLLPHSLLAAPTVINQAVGQVGGELVTSRQVRMSEIIDRWQLLPVEGRPKLTDEGTKAWIGEEKSEEFKGHLSTLLLQIMVTKEAESLGGFADQAEKDEAQVQALLKELAALKVWRDLEPEKGEVLRLLRLKRVAGEFLKLKTETGDSTLSDSDLRAYYNRNRDKLAGVSFDLVKPLIQNRLQQEKQVNQLKDWFEILKRKYGVQYFSL